MTVYRKLLLTIIILIASQLIGCSKSAQAQSYSQINFDVNRVPWVHLAYGAKNFSVEVTTTVQLKSLPAADVEAVLEESFQKVSLGTSNPEPYQITVNKIVDSIFRSPVKTVNQVWFNPQDATALGRIRLRRGKDDFKKVYRFTKQGVFRHRREPKDKQETLGEPEKWTDVKDTFYAYNLTKLGCPNVSERLLLIYIASAAEISKSNQILSFCVFGKRQLFDVRLRPEGLHSLKINFTEKTKQREVRRQGQVKALKIALEAQPLESDLEELESFSFLGFHEEIAIFIDPATNLPIQLSGKIPKIGKVTIKLRKVQLR
jgi:hypothetical protein